MNAVFYLVAGALVETRGVYGKPRQTMDVNQQEFRMIQWPDNEDIAE